MKSVLHIGLQSPFHSPKGIEKGFREAGFIDYSFQDWQQIRFSEGILGCQSRMITAAKQIMPDLIFIQIQNEDILDEETGIELSKCGFTVNYTFDVRSLERTEWMYDLAPHFGLTLFACQEDVEEAKKRGINNVEQLHSSCDADQYRPVILPEEVKYPEIVFIGNNYANTNLEFEQAQERVEMVNFMNGEFGNRFGVYGMGWEPGSKMVNSIEEVNIYNGCKIVVTHNNYKRSGYCSDRQWRSISCGAMTIPQYYEGLNTDIYSNRLAWINFDDLKRSCLEVLEWDEGHRKNVAAYNSRYFLNHHTWQHRIQTMLSMINGIKNGTGTK